MKPMPATSDIAEAVVGYCEAIDVPAFDDRILTSSPSVHGSRPTPSSQRPWIAASVAAMVVLLAISFTIPGVLGGAERIFAAFTVAGAERKTPMTIRQVDLEQARADVRFRVIAPPRIPSAPDVTIDEVSAGASAANASIVFELHGSAPGPEVMIVESADGREHAPTFFTVTRPAEDAGSPKLPSTESPPGTGRHQATLLLRGSDRYVPAPASWVVRGTRVAVMSPPGYFSKTQLQSMRTAMSH